MKVQTKKLIEKIFPAYAANPDCRLLDNSDPQSFAQRTVVRQLWPAFRMALDLLESEGYKPKDIMGLSNEPFSDWPSDMRLETEVRKRLTLRKLPSGAEENNAAFKILSAAGVVVFYEMICERLTLMERSGTNKTNAGAIVYNWGSGERHRQPFELGASSGLAAMILLGARFEQCAANIGFELQAIEVNMEKIGKHDAMISNLDRGRPKGTLARKTAAAERREKMTKAITDVLLNPRTRHMTTAEILDVVKNSVTKPTGKTYSESYWTKFLPEARRVARQSNNR